VYKVEKKLKNSVTTVPIDDNKGFKKALVGSSPAFYATCLASPFKEDEMAHCGGNGIGTLLAAAEMEDDPAPAVIVIELHPEFGLSLSEEEGKREGEIRGRQ